IDEQDGHDCHERQEDALHRRHGSTSLISVRVMPAGSRPHGGGGAALVTSTRFSGCIISLR
ncbi:MAG TPA: hypothetical protein VGR27_11040, partial [Longimicrobiaceae bacterium]|nr:hypothetical protein [Longimicrobiaceae bacterium]